MIITILIFLAVLSLLVIVHEFGHYITAKKSGVKVEEFGLGFPPRLFYWTAKDGMKWSINAIPLGGFVKIHGETGEDRNDPGSFGGKSFFTKVLILAAGVIMNFLLAAVLFSIVFLFPSRAVIEGSTSKLATISDERIEIVTIMEGSAAEEAGVLPGDEFVSLAGESYESGAEVRSALGEIEEGEYVDLIVERNGEQQTLSVTSRQNDQGVEGRLVGVAVAETAMVRYPIYLAPVKGVEVTAFYTWEILKAFGGLFGSLFAGEKVDAELSGPVGIAVLTGEVARTGIIPLLQFAAILSINLGILNILPLPALDGGRIAFVIVEAIRRKPNSPEVESAIHGIGFLILMGLVIVVTFKDIFNLVT